MATIQDWKRITAEELAEFYKTRSTYEIARHFGLSGDEPVRLKMIKFGIARRSRGGVRTFKPSKDELESLYQQHSMKDISRMFDVGETVVWKRLNEYGITLKDYEDGGHRKKSGRQFSESHREALRLAHLGKRVGENNHNWKGGKTAQGIALRVSPAYKEWKRQALKRAGGKCEVCGIKKDTECKCCGMKMPLHVHHRLPFAKHEELRFDPTNSVVMCAVCHKRSHSSK